MPPIVVYADLADGWLESNSTIYADAAEGTGTATVGFSGASSAIGVVGQRISNFRCEETLLSFDTSVASPGGSAILSLWSTQGASTAFDIEVRYKDWGTSGDTGDWVGASGLGGLTLVGTLNTASYLTSQYNDISVGSGYGNIGDGTTRYMVNSSLHRTVSTPSVDDQHIRWSSADTGGTVNDPKITIEESGNPLAVGDSWGYVANNQKGKPDVDLFYAFSGDELPEFVPPPPYVDDEDGWWGGVVRLFAGIGLGTALAAGAAIAQLPTSQYHQDDIVPQPVPVVEESEWIPSIPWGLSYVIPQAFTYDEVLPVHAFEDDSWNPPKLIQWPTTRSFTDVDEIPAGSLYGVPEDTPWQNPVVPVSATLRVPNPWDAEQNEQSAGLYGVPVESEWNVILVTPVQRSVQAFTADDEIASTPVATIAEEEYWINPTAPVPVGLQIPNPWVWEQNDIVGISLVQDIDGFDDTSQSSYTTASFTPGANNLIIASVLSSIGAGTVNVPTCSGCGLTWDLVGFIRAFSDTRIVAVFRALSATPVTGAITFDYAGQAQVRASWFISEYTNVDTSGINGSAAVPQYNTGVVVSTALAITLNPLAEPGSASYGVVRQGNFGGTVTAGAGYTELGSIQQAGAINSQSQWMVPGSTTVDWTFSVGSGTAQGVALEIKPPGTPKPLDDGDWHNLVPAELISFKSPKPWQWEQNEQATELYGVLEETEWIPPVLPQQWIASPYSSTDDIVAPVVTSAFESEWIQLVQPEIQWKSQLFSDTDEIERLTIEETEWQIQLPTEVPLFVKAFVDETEFVPPIVQDYGDTYLYVPPQVQTIVSAFSYDDVISTVVVAQFEEDSGWVLRLMDMPKTPPLVFTTNDDHKPYSVFPPIPPSPQRGCCNVGGVVVAFGGCEEGAPVIFDDCPCPS